MRTGWAALGAATIVLAAACSASTGGGPGTGGDGDFAVGPGIDPASKTITVGEISILSGPAGVIGKPLTAGLSTYLNAVNDSGGIDGWKIKTDIQDSKYSAALSAQLFATMSSNVAVIAQSLGSPTTHAFDAKAAADNIVVGTAAQDSTFVTKPNNAVIGTPYAAEAANSVAHIAKQKPGAKVAIFYQNDAFGADGKRGYDAAVAAGGLENVEEVTYTAESTTPNFTSQVQQLRDSGAEYVFVVATPQPTSTLIKTAASSGFKPQWVLQSPAWSEFLMSSTGTPAGTPTDAAAVLTGAWVGGYTALWGDRSVPGMAIFLERTTKYAPDQAPSTQYLYGYCMARMITAILQKAIASKDLTRAGIMHAKLHLGKVGFDGLMPDAHYSPDLGPASRQSTLYRVDPAATGNGYLTSMTPFTESEAAKSLRLGG